MEKSRMLWIASKAIAKNYSQEDVWWGDDCYELSGEEGNKIKDEIMDFMDELVEIGRIAFYEKYKDFKLY